MSIAENGAGFDPKPAPKDYAQLFSHYWPYTVALVGKNGIHESNREDVAAEILYRLMQRDLLTMFDPTLTFTYEGRVRDARFKNFLSFMVVKYCKGHRDKQNRRSDREMLVMDKPTEYNDVPSTWAEWWGIGMIDSHEDVILEGVVGDKLIADIRAYLQTVPKRSAYDKCDLVALFDAVIDQVRTGDTVVLRELRDKFGCSGTGMNGWMWWLRANISDYLGVPLPPKRVRRASA